jgi:hypothetical protein
MLSIVLYGHESNNEKSRQDDNAKGIGKNIQYECRDCACQQDADNQQGHIHRLFSVIARDDT